MSHVIIKAGIVFLCEFLASAQPVFYADVLQEGFQRGDIWEGPVIGRSVLYHGAGLEETGKPLISDAEHGIGFSVFQLYVEMRGIFFYKVVLQNECLVLILGDDIFN